MRVCGPQLAAPQACLPAEFSLTQRTPCICRLAASSIEVEYIPLPKDRAFLDTIWPLYKQTGEKNGFCVLTEQEFYDFHLNTPDLTVMLMKVCGVVWCRPCLWYSVNCVDVAGHWKRAVGAAWPGQSMETPQQTVGCWLLLVHGQRFPCSNCKRLQALRKAQGRDFLPVGSGLCPCLMSLQTPQGNTLNAQSLALYSVRCRTPAMAASW
jgi:hypothetical protein